MNVHETGRPGEPKRFIDRQAIPTLTQWRADIIDRILIDGLNPGIALVKEEKHPLLSHDTTPTSWILGCIIDPSDNLEQLHANLYDSLYLGRNSVIPVVIEREYDEYNTPAHCQARANASFLVICTTDNMQRAAPKPSLGYDLAIAPDRFIYVVFPEDILDEYLTTSNAEQHKTKVKIAKNLVARGIYWQLEPAKVPNYEEVLIEILEELRQPVWVHGVRLPTEEDLERLVISTPQEAE